MKLQATNGRVCPISPSEFLCLSIFHQSFWLWAFVYLFYFMLTICLSLVVVHSLRLVIIGELGCYCSSCCFSISFRDRRHSSLMKLNILQNRIPSWDSQWFSSLNMPEWNSFPNFLSTDSLNGTEVHSQWAFNTWIEFNLVMLCAQVEWNVQFINWLWAFFEAERSWTM